jgi:NADPH-dependent ferric siderophore reductase
MTANQMTARRRPVPADLFGGRLSDAYLLDLEIVAVADVAPHVRTLTVSSPDLVGFSYRPGQDLMIEFPNGERTVRRRYTLRRADSAAGTAELEFELHGGDGVAARWAASHAEVGRHLDAIGPRGNISIRPDAPAHLFVADDSAMPAAFAMIEALPSDAAVAAILVTPHGANSRPAPTTVIGTTTMWIDEHHLSDAVASFGIKPGTAAYVNGERRLVQQAVELLIGAGTQRDDIASKAYWRRDQPNAAHGEPLQD